MSAPLNTEYTSPAVFRAHGEHFARAEDGTFLRLSPAQVPAEQWIPAALEAAERRTAARSGLTPDQGTVMILDQTRLEHEASPVTHLRRLLTARGFSVHSGDHAPVEQAASETTAPMTASELRITIRTSPSDETPSEQHGRAEHRTEEHLIREDRLDVHAEGAQWFIHPLRTEDSDPTSAQVRRRRLAASPAHQALDSWWKLAGLDPRRHGPAEILHRAIHQLCPTGAALIAWHLTEIVESWGRGALDPRRSLTIVDSNTLEVSTHPVLAHPTPHGRAPGEALR